MKQYKVELWFKGGIGGFEGQKEEQIITCYKLIRDQKHNNIVYADGRKIEFNWCEIINISIVS